MKSIQYMSIITEYAYHVPIFLYTCLVLLIWADLVNNKSDLAHNTSGIFQMNILLIQDVQIMHKTHTGHADYPINSFKYTDLC